MIDKATIQKYDIPGPRYTSYPTAPEWTHSVTPGTYAEKLKEFGAKDKTLSIYFHIPFCESLCYFCACNVLIRKKEEKYGNEYLDYLTREMDLIYRSIGTKKVVRQLHLGGGTPTFLSEDQLERLFEKINQVFSVDYTNEVAVEIEPRRITKNKIRRLKELGVNRISMGIQDFDPEVQNHVNRIQPFDHVREVYDWCREAGFHSINFDLIYGLPYQTLKSFTATLDKVCFLRPDRIALYSFAHVPWLKKHQNKLEPKKLPHPDVKLDIFLKARSEFLNNGYLAIAMDHFALKSDELAQSFTQGNLYRNFMGYTVKPADEYIGLGITAIGFLENTFFQNQKTLADYYRMLTEGKLPIERGKVLSADDRIRQWVIRALMCQFSLNKKEFEINFMVPFDTYFEEEKNHLLRCQSDGLLNVTAEAILITDLGKLFIRNICMGFDWYLRQKDTHKRFSRTI